MIAANAGEPLKGLNDTGIVLIVPITFPITHKMLLSHQEEDIE